VWQDAEVVWILPLLILTGWSSLLAIMSLGSCSSVTILGDVAGLVDVGGCRVTCGDQSDAGVSSYLLRRASGRCCRSSRGHVNLGSRVWAQACPHLSTAHPRELRMRGGRTLIGRAVEHSHRHQEFQVDEVVFENPTTPRIGN
jgi:hypothetical protein